jgi:hypothetical protein
MPQTARHAKNGDARSRVVARRAALPDGPLQVKGVVVRPDEKPLVGAGISPALVSAREKEITTETTGAFSFTLDDVPSALILNVTAPGLAARTFWGHFINAVDFSAGIDPREMIIAQTGRITRPLRLATPFSKCWPTATARWTCASATRFWATGAMRRTLRKRRF